MGQNTSSAVMQQCRDRDDVLNYFPTPPWATRALCEVLPGGVSRHLQRVWEPACGEGHMAMPLGESFGEVIATDIHDYSGTFAAQAGVADFLFDPLLFRQFGPAPDWVITNPPFRLAEQFIRQGLQVCTMGCAFFVRSAFLEGVGRYQSLFSDHPPGWIYQFSERVPLRKGRLDRGLSTATSYCWLVFPKSRPSRTEFHWFAPCRARLERSADCPEQDAPVAAIPLFEGGA